MNLSKENYVDIVPLWNKELIMPLLTSLKLAPGTSEFTKLTNAPSSSYTEDHNPSGIPLYCPSYPTSQRSLKCSHCDTAFSSREEQIAHYTLDWHRFNLKQSIDGFSPVSQEQFTNKTCEAQDDKESGNNSTTDDEEKSNEEDIVIKRNPRIFFVNEDGVVISIYRTILHHKKTEIWNEAELVQRVSGASNKLYWTIILAGGGHFAAAVFQGQDVVAHKTFHSYTVRAKQGKTQSGRDNRNATSHPRSAGASLRRYNEQVHNQHIQELLQEWKEHIAKSNLIFFKCPRSNTRLLFGGQNSILSKTDERLRTIPFPTKKPTFAEVKKVHKNLSHIYIYGELEDAAQLGGAKSPFKKSSSSPSKIASKKVEKVSKKLSKDEMARLDTHEISHFDQSSSDEDMDELIWSFETIDTSCLQPYGSSVEDDRMKNRLESNQCIRKVNSSENEDPTTELRKLENFVYTACRMGNLINLKAVYQLSKFRDFTDVSDAIPRDVLNLLIAMDQSVDILKMKFGIHEKTLLHVAAENGHKDLIWWLLDAGCDSSVVNKKNETPYIATKVKETRNHFRRYVAANPHKYDYEKAKIPGPLTEEDENIQKMKREGKKKQQKKNKREREKELKKKDEERRKEEEEKINFLELSDREKRALAAEKRMQAVKEERLEDSTVLRCFQCATDTSKIVPFTYSDFQFCSTACVRDHRIKSTLL